jgi:hypothetical protein
MHLRQKLLSPQAFVPVSAVRSVLLTPDPGVGVIAGLVALFAAFWNLHIVLLFFLVVAAGGIDLAVGARRAHLQEKEGRGAFTRQRLDEGLWSKALFLVVSIFLGVCIDSLIALGGTVGDLGFALPFKAFTPVTAAMLFYRLLREITSIMRNVEQAPGGRDALWPALSRVIDTLRYRMTTDPSAKAPPARRWDDGLSAEDRALALELLAERRKSDLP